MKIKIFLLRLLKEREFRKRRKEKLNANLKADGWSSVFHNLSKRKWTWTFSYLRPTNKSYRFSCFFLDFLTKKIRLRRFPLFTCQKGVVFGIFGNFIPFFRTNKFVWILCIFFQEILLERIWMNSNKLRQILWKLISNH